MSFLNTLNSISNSLNRIATALELQAGIDNFPSDIEDKKSTKMEMYSPSNSIESDDYKIEAREEFEREVKEKGGNFFFEEDAVSQETIDRL